MTDNLFEIEESPSPRLNWLRRHGIHITDNGNDYKPGEEDEITGERLYRYWATCFSIPSKPEAGGDTEDEAIVSLAKIIPLKLWNETN